MQHRNINSKNKIITTFVFIILIIVAILPSITSSKLDILSPLQEDDYKNTKDIYLLRVEHYLYIKAKKDSGIFNLKYSYPPDYTFQTPVFLEIFNDSTAPIIEYKIENDEKSPNKLINFKINNIVNDQDVLIHFNCWVLVEGHDYSDMPEYVEFPKKSELPVETKNWLSSTDVVQSKSYLIHQKALDLKGNSKNLIDFADKVATYIKEHMYFLFVLQLNLRLFFTQDALTTLFINGENVGRSHLGCALFRSLGVPARVLLALPDQHFWTQMHYLFEYYCPGYGWILVDTTRAKTPFQPHRQVINRICYPSDEEDTKTDYIIPTMKGEERWMWFSTNKVYPYYVDCKQGSKSQMFEENILNVDAFVADNTIFNTELVFHQYQKFLDLNLSGENLDYFIKAIKYQKQALTELSSSDDVFDYLFYLDKAYDEYKNIDI